MRTVNVLEEHEVVEGKGGYYIEWKAGVIEAIDELDVKICSLCDQHNVNLDGTTKHHVILAVCDANKKFTYIVKVVE